MTPRKIHPDVEPLRNHETATKFLKNALDHFVETGESVPFLQALRKLTKAQGGMTKLSNNVGINRQNLYRTFAETGNPKLRPFVKIVKGLGFKLTVEPLDQNNSDDANNDNS